ncbi:Tar ligand binding domain-containing protein, partial [Escherichia coli]|uniref:Tar ligand binding domain-containing protein n=1 Tax=Escherichia coli TaxID=562 RepID=UPI001951C863
MLKRIKIVTSLLLVLAVFGLLQLTSGGLFFNALKNDKENFGNDSNLLIVFYVQI